MERTIVKIDLCKSKIFNYSGERTEPAIRSKTLEHLLDIANPYFPNSELTYPEGSYYKSEGDAIYYIFDSPTIALRASINFMQNWHHKSANTLPECRAIIHQGKIELLNHANRIEIAGRPFEDISIIEKNLLDGRIFVTNNFMSKCDKTISKFSHFCDIKITEERTINILLADYDDPRTLEDSSLIHALFVSTSQSKEVRETIFELFATEYLLEHQHLDDIANFNT